MAAIDEIVENFGLLDDWEDRYRYVIELGNTLEPLSETEHSDQYKVRGCVSQVWLVSSIEQSGDGAPVLVFRGNSDAHIVRGLIAILISLYSGKTADFIAKYDAEALFAKLGLGDHLTQQRSNGLASMVARIRSDAQAVLQSS